MAELRRESNRGGNIKLKRYQEMLVNNMMGTSRHNEPLQAVIENKLAETAFTETNNSILERNRALLQYAATIANSNSNTDVFNYEFIECLVEGGADINTADQYEQTIFHEVSRSWNTDVAKFLIGIGCDINKQDSFGRSPLHVAAAVDYAEMTEFLLQNNANIDARTFGEQQAPIHYAAKNGAVRSLKILLGYHADINSLDAKLRTPLQLSAEWTRDGTVEVLIDKGASSCLLDASGNSALCVLIDRLPNFALEALNQLHRTDIITRQEYYYLQYLEASRLKRETKSIRTPLEVAVMTRKYEIVTHPVMQRLIHNKWKQYGKFSTIIDLLFHVLYGIIWTAACSGVPNTAKEMWQPFNADIWLKVLATLIILMTMYDVVMQIQTTRKTRKSQKVWVTWRSRELEDDMQYCHPRWPQEEKYVKLEIKRIKSLPLLNVLDAWFYFEWIVIILIFVTCATHFVYYTDDTTATRYVYTRTLSIVNLLVWLRLLKYVRPFPGLGTLVVILGETASDFVNWAFLYFLLLVPFTAAFWINFGDLSLTPVDGYEDVHRLLYSVFRMAVGDNFNFEGLAKADPVMSRILVVLYIVAMTIVTLNLLIALLSDTFGRVYSNAVANTIMQRAVKVMNAERSLTKNARTKYQEFMRLNCSPEVIPTKINATISASAEEVVEKEILHHLNNMKELLLARIAPVYGNNKASDFDKIIQGVAKLKTCQEEMANDLMRIQEMLKQYKALVKERSRRDRETQQLMIDSSTAESTNFVSSLQDAASSFYQNFIKGNADEKKASRSKSGRISAVSGRESSEPSRKERRRKRREARGSGDKDSTTSIKMGTRTQSRETNDWKQRTTRRDNPVLAPPPADMAWGRTPSLENSEIDGDDSQRESVSLDSLSL